MRLAILSDNNSACDQFESEHGLSIYLEQDALKYLFDTGASSLFIRNAETLGINLSEVDYLFISHAHNDHIGGLIDFLNINSKAKIILSKNALNRKLFSKRTGLREIGNDINPETFKEKIIYIGDMPLDTENFVVTHIETNKYSMPKGNSTLFKGSIDKLESDDFDHEIVVATGQKNLFVYTGCAHHGLLNALESIDRLSSKPIDIIAGGFHLLEGENFEKKEEIEDIIIELQNKYQKAKVLSGNCTGINALEMFKEKLQNKFTSFYTGFEMIL
ncbi:MBL fold metallo-hydrolase [Paludibacter sp.]